jgi:sec-independent protein translocase protein TatB
MFDIGIWEIGVIGVVALVVLGPERLPKVARTAGHMFGRLQRYVANVKADINREMETSDLAKMKEEVQSAARTFETSVREHANALESESRAIEKTATPTLDAGGNSQAALLAEQDASVGIAPPGPAISSGAPSDNPAPANSTSPATTTASDGAMLSPAKPLTVPTAEGYAAAHAVHQKFDLGIEAPRQLKRSSHPTRPNGSA